MRTFVHQLFSMLNQPDYKEWIHWLNDEDSIFVITPYNQEFGDKVLKKYFKHGNFSSFVRQLHMYGFQKLPIKNNDDSNGNVSITRGNELNNNVDIEFFNNDNPMYHIPSRPKRGSTTWHFTHPSGFFHRNSDVVTLNRIQRKSSTVTKNGKKINRLSTISVCYLNRDYSKPELKTFQEDFKPSYTSITHPLPKIENSSTENIESHQFPNVLSQTSTSPFANLPKLQNKHLLPRLPLQGSSQMPTLLTPASSNEENEKDINSLEYFQRLDRKCTIISKAILTVSEAVQTLLRNNLQNNQHLPSMSADFDNSLLTLKELELEISRELNLTVTKEALPSYNNLKISTIIESNSKPDEISKSSPSEASALRTLGVIRSTAPLVNRTPVSSYQDPSLISLRNGQNTNPSPIVQNSYFDHNPNKLSNRSYQPDRQYNNI
ncbi:hypothetical protein Kpol_1050p79 [Vanderwaltozyma polyspora DSM 70294]|uniref:HSF-type DNA-binding domain-containing protein n=1 Tax=Vanderwaltozyma polyspora (strain ATCC 22028 / DSM 70294 / BCRC 21397 / CBS 2163 / NBRC 10782 / NRRL Y-8283 / UCD 57-17) TaxID=436907 RepID=A7TEX3_VANPO|nr:uncharacterized protein Kpol_1050p79 [Vanderwaltozyma polyspora DSM 70294]EDO19219.1 hypothetical protein Kpol_1050p79 [Vanderwaltozyma polyspora DSM 70294]